MELPEEREGQGQVFLLTSSSVLRRGVMAGLSASAVTPSVQ